MKNLRAPQPEALRELRRPRPFRAHWIPGLLAAVAAVAVGCRSSLAQIREGLAAEQGGAAAEEQLLRTAHRGPAVVAGESGPARFARKVDAAFDSERAAATVRFVDGFYRAPGNDGYEAVLDRLAAELRAAGYGEHERLELREISTPLTAPIFGQRSRGPARAWTPKSGRLALRTRGNETVLHAFDEPGDVDRVMLPINTPPGRAEARFSMHLDDLDEGEILVMEAAPSTSVLMRAQSIGAAAVVSASLHSFNIDPTGRERHLEAIQFRTIPYGVEMPVVQISPRSYRRIEEAHAADPQARLALDVDVEWSERPLRTLVAAIVGSDRPDEAVVTVSHVQEPGAGDNATGVAGLLESARLMVDLLEKGRMEWPSRTLVFIWGDEFRQTQAWLDDTERTPIVGLSSDMTGQSREKTGAIALLERMPDPGAVRPLAPDVHTPWGKNEVDASKLVPNGLAVIARCALADVAAFSEGWNTAEHPWEGGSDHDEFIARAVPAVLFWHFTDFAYHTSLDRLDHVDPVELQRTAVALLSTALAVADPEPGDLDRYLRTLRRERVLRVEAAEAAGDATLADQWRAWCEGAHEWLRIECLRIPPSER